MIRKTMDRMEAFLLLGRIEDTLYSALKIDNCEYGGAIDIKYFNDIAAIGERSKKLYAYLRNTKDLEIIEAFYETSALYKALGCIYDKLPEYIQESVCDYERIYINIMFMLGHDTERMLHPQKGLSLPKELNTDEAKALRLYLIEKSYISDQTDESIFLYWFGCLNTHNNPQPIIWIKKNSKTGSPSKKSLLDLLVLVGYNENQIKQNINNAFIIDGGKKFKAQDYTKYKDWSRDVISEYHIEIENIVNNSKK